jgi:hypothetical protein
MQVPRVVGRQSERLTIAYIDGDAVCATVEKHDDARLADEPVIVRAGRRWLQPALPVARPAERRRKADAAIDPVRSKPGETAIGDRRSSSRGQLQTAAKFGPTMQIRLVAHAAHRKNMCNGP